MAERFEDLHALLSADWQILDGRLGVIDLEPVFVRELKQPCGGRLVINHRPRLDGLGTEDHIIGHAENRDEHEMLMHHSDAVIDRVLWIDDFDLLVVNQYLSLVGSDQSVEDVHQG